MEEEYNINLKEETTTAVWKREQQHKLKKGTTTMLGRRKNILKDGNNASWKEGTAVGRREQQEQWNEGNNRN